jgi:biopolymer transport protein TolR
MAVSPLGEGKGRRKAVDADLNLVPYIDLLTCMVAFLLITAVWSQLARLSVAQKGQGEESLTPIEKGPRIAVLVLADGFSVVAEDTQKPIPKRDGQLDYAALKTALAYVKDTHPDAKDVQILSEDGIIFDTLVRTMDVAIATGFPDVALLDAAAGS